MKTVTRYIADDGLEFVSEGACVRYEALCKEVAEIMAKLSPIPELPGCGFSNGEGYLQHDPSVVAQVRASLLRIANTIFPHKWFDQSIADPNVDPSWAGRLIGEFNEKCLRSAWGRMSCMTANGREYGQPYFVTNPHRAKDVCLNARSA